MSKVRVVRIETVNGGHEWLVEANDAVVARFPGRLAARRKAKELREQTPVFEVKERNPFIEGPAPEPGIDPVKLGKVVDAELDAMEKP